MSKVVCGCGNQIVLLANVCRWYASQAVLSAPSLISVLRRFIDQISDVRCLVISTAEGVELLSG